MGITEMLDELKSKACRDEMHSLSVHFVGNAENWDMRSTIWI